MASTSPVLLKTACQNWMRLSVTNKVCVKEALLDILHDPVDGISKDKQTFFALLVAFKAKEEKNLKGVIKPFQWQILCHVCDANCSIPCLKNGKTDSNDLDITCIIVLIIHLTKFPPPLGRNGWKIKLPIQGDTSVAAFVVLARDLRNRLSHCSLNNLQTKADFDKEWKQMESILLGIGYKDMAKFRQFELASLDPYLNHQVQTLKDEVSNLAQVDINNLKCLISQVDQKLDAVDVILRLELDNIKLQLDKFDLRITENKRNIQIQDQRVEQNLQDNQIQKQRLDQLTQQQNEVKEDVQDIQYQLQQSRTKFNKIGNLSTLFLKLLENACYELILCTFLSLIRCQNILYVNNRE